MSKTGQVPGKIASLGELLGVAAAMEQAAATRYRHLSSQMQDQGDSALAAQFEALASTEDHHGAEIAARSQALLGHAPGPSPLRWESPAESDEEAARSRPSTSYQALALAVRNEERAFAFYTYVAAEAEQPDIRALAEALARDELQHATLLRQYRRRAFHAERPVPVELPGSADALRATARDLDARASAAHAALASILDETGDSEDAGRFRRLADQEAEAAKGTAAFAVPALRGAADGLRLVEAAFDRYALIAERAKDELVVAEAQRLAGEIVVRLALFGDAGHNPLPDA